MLIANPIYDSAFKFMLEDKQAAKAFLGGIIKERIIELSLTPTEIRAKLPNAPDEDPPLAVFHIDFSAKIKMAEGKTKTITIELQKAKLQSDLMRFRRYIGSQYQNKEVAFPLYCVYILGGGYYRDLPHKPFIEIRNDIYDGISGKKIEFKKTSEFISGLHHNSKIIQVSQLPDESKSDIEKLLSIFNQKRKSASIHILDIDEKLYPKEYRAIIRQLQKACVSKDVLDCMQAEDDYLEELLDKERLIEKQNKKLIEKDNVIAEKDLAMVALQKEKDNALAEKDLVLVALQKEKDIAEESKRRERELLSLIKELKNAK